MRNYIFNMHFAFLTRGWATANYFLGDWNRLPTPIYLGNRRLSHFLENSGYKFFLEICRRPFTTQSPAFYWPNINMETHLLCNSIVKAYFFGIGIYAVTILCSELFEILGKYGMEHHFIFFGAEYTGSCLYAWLYTWKN